MALQISWLINCMCFSARICSPNLRDCPGGMYACFLGGRESTAACSTSEWGTKCPPKLPECKVHTGPAYIKWAAAPPVPLQNKHEPRILGATAFAASLHTSRLASLMSRADAACKSMPGLQISMNAFDGKEALAVKASGQRRVLSCAANKEDTCPLQDKEARIVLPRCLTPSLFMQIPGMKGLYWKKALTPEITEPFEFVWLFDNDMGIHQVSSGGIPTMARFMHKLKLPAAQPSIRSDEFSHGSVLPFLNLESLQKHPLMPRYCSLFATEYIEVMAPLFSQNAWAFLHRRLFMDTPDWMLFNSDYGISDVWCRMLSQEYMKNHTRDTPPACGVFPTVSIAHLDYHTISAMGNPNKSAPIRENWEIRDRYMNYQWRQAQDYDGVPGLLLPCIKRGAAGHLPGTPFYYVEDSGN